MRYDAITAINAYNERQKEILIAQLYEMSPYDFEHLVCSLLGEMGYEDVEITPRSGDMGIDAIATVPFGIASLRVAVQIKRQKGAISRPVLDQLRGALRYHDATLGMIITVGKFSEGCIEAALLSGTAPIELIDGSRLIDLMIEHGFGIQKQGVELYEVDEALLRSFDEKGSSRKSVPNTSVVNK